MKAERLLKDEIQEGDHRIAAQARDLQKKTEYFLEKLLNELFLIY